jgi:hypothetical protein
MFVHWLALVLICALLRTMWLNLTKEIAGRRTHMVSRARRFRRRRTRLASDPPVYRKSPDGYILPPARFRVCPCQSNPSVFVPSR